LEILKSWGCDLPNLQAETVKGALALGEAG